MVSSTTDLPQSDWKKYWSGSSSDDTPLATGQATVPSTLSLTLWMFEVNFVRAMVVGYLKNSNIYDSGLIEHCLCWLMTHHISSNACSSPRSSQQESLTVLLSEE